jgi:hypothetical protein
VRDMATGRSTLAGCPDRRTAGEGGRRRGACGSKKEGTRLTSGRLRGATTGLEDGA